MSVFSKQRALERLEDRLRTVEIKCDGLESANRKLDLEFSELYDKVSHQMSRMAARHRKAAKENGDEPPDDLDISHTDSLDPISRSIMLRRSRQAGTA